MMEGDGERPGFFMRAYCNNAAFFSSLKMNRLSARHGRQSQMH